MLGWRDTDKETIYEFKLGLFPNMREQLSNMEGVYMMSQDGIIDTGQTPPLTQYIQACLNMEANRKISYGDRDKHFDSLPVGKKFTSSKQGGTNNYQKKYNKDAKQPLYNAGKSNNNNYKGNKDTYKGGGHKPNATPSSTASSSTAPPSVPKNKDYSNLKCFQCGKFGHKASNCPAALVQKRVTTATAEKRNALQSTTSSVNAPMQRILVSKCLQ